MSGFAYLIPLRGRRVEYAPADVSFANTSSRSFISVLILLIRRQVLSAVFWLMCFNVIWACAQYDISDLTDNKQLLGEAEHIKNYLDRGLRYRSEAEADNIDRGLNNSWYHAKAESNNCFIIHLKTSGTYKTIKRSLPFCLFYFRALLIIGSSSSCWLRQGLGTTESNNCFFGYKFDKKHPYYWTLSTSALENWELLRISRCGIHTKCIIICIID